MRRAMDEIRLALIGTGIDRSRAPRLHEAAGRLCGLRVRYALRPLDDASPGALEAAIARCVEDGCTGINITHPFKERAVALVDRPSPEVQRLASLNTVRFAAGGAREGFNTDHSGFMAAYRRAFGDESPGTVGIAGAGGAGRAVAFALAALGARRVRLYDREPARAEALSVALGAAAPGTPVDACACPEAVAEGADGLVNCTPLGMHHVPGSALPPALLAGRRWVFDAVYTPPETEFVRAARAAGARVLGGYELFLYQGIHAFHIFCGADVDEAALRRALEG